MKEQTGRGNKQSLTHIKFKRLYTEEILEEKFWPDPGAEIRSVGSALRIPPRSDPLPAQRLSPRGLGDAAAFHGHSELGNLVPKKPSHGDAPGMALLPDTRWLKGCSWRLYLYAWGDRGPHEAPRWFLCAPRPSEPFEKRFFGSASAAAHCCPANQKCFTVNKTGNSSPLKKITTPQKTSGLFCSSAAPLTAGGDGPNSRDGT